MITRKYYSGLFFYLIIAHLLFFTGFSVAEEPVEIFTLEETITLAIQVNLELKSSKEETAASLSAKKAQRTHFFPTFSTSYKYTRSDEGARTGGLAMGSKDEYGFVTSFSQPIFTGFSLLNQYKISRLGLDVSKTSESLLRQDIIFESKKRYFELLQTQKLIGIAKETVTQIAAQKDVAENFYKVGMTPLNDFLQAQVELANAEQELIVAKNNLDNAEANFNVLLRRPIRAPVKVADILEYSPFEQDIDYCFDMAERNRLETKISDLEIEIAEKELALAKKDYFPTISLEGNYFFYGDDWDVDGGAGIFDPEGWNVMAVASWNFWEWGKTAYGAKEKLSRLTQAELKKEALLDNIHLEVKNAFLRTQEAEKAMIAVKKAIEQAKENFRINEERYKEQIATQTDVLNAQTLLSETITKYYNALYAFKIAKAALYRAMGQENMQ